MPTDVQSTGNAYGQKRLLRTVNGVRYYSDGSTERVSTASFSQPASASEGWSTMFSPGSSSAYTAPSSSSAPPVDPGYQQTLFGLQESRDNTLAADAKQRQAALSDYGYSLGPSGLTMDTSNPFSRASLLQKTFQQQQTGNTNSYAARGQLYSGALQNAQNTANVNYQQGQNTLQTQLQQILAQLEAQDAAARASYDTAAGQALSTSIQNAPSNPTYTPAPAVKTNTNPVVSSQPWTDSSGRKGKLNTHADGSRVFVPG